MKPNKKIVITNNSKNDWYSSMSGTAFDVLYDNPYLEAYIVKHDSELRHVYYVDCIVSDNTQTDKHYDNKNGSIYKFCVDHDLNSYEFDIIKRITRCRKKGQFIDDLEKTKRVIDLYLKEYEQGRD